MNGTTNTICQSASIMRFIGRIAVPDLLYPTDIIKASTVDSLLDEEIDLFMGLAVSRYRGRFGFEAIGDYNGPILQDIRKCLNDDIIPRHLDFFERILSESTTGWLADTHHPSIADFQLVPRLQWLKVHGEGISNDILVTYTRVNNLMDKLMNDPCIQSYYNK
jgi:glutathione S-transferase